ncbi:MarR family transcriptional regulator, partial [Streptomyces canus]|uniref:MarR family winged helix-turn-helix transcriptional regulator n=1 Tax=Streptomyces canus TaxID=58343 RepID=UPI00348FB478
VDTPPPSTRGGCPGLVAAGFVERVVCEENRREVRLHLSGRGRAFLVDLRARRERELQTVLADMPAAKRVALLEGLEAFCAAAAGQTHVDAAGSGSRTA